MLYAIAKIRRAFMYPNLSKSQEVKNEVEVSAKGKYIRSKLRIQCQNGSIYDIVGYEQVGRNSGLLQFLKVKMAFFFWKQVATTNQSIMSKRRKGTCKF